MLGQPDHRHNQLERQRRTSRQRHPLRASSQRRPHLDRVRGVTVLPPLGDLLHADQQRFGQSSRKPRGRVGACRAVGRFVKRHAVAQCGGEFSPRTNSSCTSEAEASLACERSAKWNRAAAASGTEAWCSRTSTTRLWSRAPSANTCSNGHDMRVLLDQLATAGLLASWWSGTGR